MMLKFPHKKNILLAVSLVLILVLIPLIAWGLRTLKYQRIEQTYVPRSTPTPSSKPLVVKGSIPYWDQQNAFQSFQENISLFNYVNLFWYYLGRSGEVVKYAYAIEDRGIVEYAHANNIKVSAVITNLPEFQGASWDSERVENVISDSEIRNDHIENIIKKINELDFDGIIIDYESVRIDAKENFSIFIRELYIELHENGKELAVVLHPRSGNRIRGEENGWFQDWKVLSEYSDHLQIMAYGEHYDEGEAGPIASLPWVEKIITYAKSLNIPGNKLFLGIPLYGYDWNKDDDSAAEGLTYADVKSIQDEYDVEEKWNDGAKSPYFFYKDGSEDHEVWFENAESVKAKISEAITAQIGGISFWRLGGEDSEISV